MTSYNPVIKNAGAIIYLPLPSMATSGTFQVNPTIVPGDVKISVDGGAFANLATLPTVTPAGGAAVKVTLTGAETNGDNVEVHFVDQTAPKEWGDTAIRIATVARNFDALAFPLTAGRGELVDATGQVTVGAYAAGAITAAAFAADAITAAAVATDAIGSSELAASAVTKIQTGLSTLDAAAVRAAVGLAAANLDTQLAGILNKVLDAPGVRAAVGLAAANLDSQLSTIAGYIDTEVAAILAKVNTLPAAPAAVSDIPTANANADALLDRAAGIETGLTVRQFSRLVAAVLLGKASGLEGTSPIYRNFGDTKNRVSATVDVNGNRTAVAYDAS